MNIIFVLVPLSLLLLGAAVWALFWAVDAGQFDDLDRPGRSILEDDQAAGSPTAGGNPPGPGSLPPPDGGS